MNRSQLEHILRAAAAITGADQFIIIGSQALLTSHADLPSEFTASIEADVFTFRSPRDAELIEGTIGELSPFHQTFGYYAHGVGPETATLPRCWKDRLVPLRTSNTGSATGLGLETHDLAISKLVAGRPKDLDFIAALIKHGLARPETLRERLDETEINPELHRACIERLKRIESGNQRKQP